GGRTGCIWLTTGCAAAVGNWHTRRLIMAGPLEGVRVLDLSAVLSGPMAAGMLADQGADVIKVESPGGDTSRLIGPRKADISAMFLTANRGKRSIVLD